MIIRLIGELLITLLFFVAFGLGWWTGRTRR